MALAMAAVAGTAHMARMGPAHADRAGHCAAGLPPLTGLLLLYFTAYALRAGTLLVAAPAGSPLISARRAPSAAAGPRGPCAGGTGPPRHAPEVAVACRISMALGMVAMLLAL
jgi:hypothetical protein